jgi:hypothetical protein
MAENEYQLSASIWHESESGIEISAESIRENGEMIINGGINGNHQWRRESVMKMAKMASKMWHQRKQRNQHGSGVKA